MRGDQREASLLRRGRDDSHERHMQVVEAGERALFPGRFGDPRRAFESESYRGDERGAIRCVQRGDARHLKKFIGDVGTGQLYYARAGWLRRHGIPGIGRWFTQKSQSGGGPWLDLGVHILDLSLWLMGSPRPLAVSASTYARFGPRGLGNWPGTRCPLRDNKYDVEDMAVAFIRLAGGGTLHLEVSWAAYTSAQDDYFVHLFGDEGGAELNVKNYTQVDTLRFYTRSAGEYAEIKPEYLELPGHGGVMQDFIDAIIYDKPASPSGEDGLTILRIIDAIYRSAASGHEVELGE